MLGLYPDCPGSNLYQLSTPFFERIDITLDHNTYPGQSFVIQSPNLSEENIYIKSIKLDKTKLDKFTLDHDKLVHGGKLRLKLSDSR